MSSIKQITRDGKTIAIFQEPNGKWASQAIVEGRSPVYLSRENSEERAIEAGFKVYDIYVEEEVQGSFDL